jgi:nitroreductase
MQPLSALELLTTTRAVRRRLDLDRPVPAGVLRECIEVALQAPTGGNAQGWHFVVVQNAAKRAGLADLYRRAWARYRPAKGSVYDLADREPEGPRKAQLQRVAASADFLVDHLHRVPVHVIPCASGRTNALSGPHATVGHASFYGSVLPAAWSFMLAARLHGLGTAWTTAHLVFEQEAAALLGIPYDSITQVALIPTAYRLGSGFRPALRRRVDDILHVDSW